jgi:methylated-DNA-[protein]-cysteine S-methyltransferase
MDGDGAEPAVGFATFIGKREFRLEEAAMYACRFDTPLGEMVAVVDEERRLKRLSFVEGREKVDRSAPRDEPRCEEAVSQVAEYFSGRRKIFELPLAPDGTPFQRDVWRALTEIPYGERTSYSAIAKRIGRDEAVRAVGAANGANPIAVVVPCHRVIGADGSLTGYGAGLPVKRWLLDFEAGLRCLPLSVRAAAPSSGTLSSRRGAGR